MKHLLLILPLAACAPHVYVKETHHAQVDRADYRAFLDHNHPHAFDDGYNGAGSASSDALSDDSNGDGSDG